MHYVITEQFISALCYYRAIDLIEHTFVAISEKEINIQEIEECDINVSCQELDHNIRDLESYINNIVLPAIKQLDREIK